mgnify:CR=1 FL=1
MSIELSLDINTNILKDSVHEAPNNLVSKEHVCLEAWERLHPVECALRNHSDVTMAGLESDVCAIFSIDNLHSM